MFCKFKPSVGKYTSPLEHLGELKAWQELKLLDNITFIIPGRGSGKNGSPKEVKRLTMFPLRFCYKIGSS